MSSFGDKLKKLREEVGITQSQLAKKTKVSRSAVAQYETNRQMPDLASLKDIADFFDVSIDYLLGRTNQRYSNENMEPTHHEKQILDDTVKEYNNTYTPNLVESLMKEAQNLRHSQLLLVLNLVKELSPIDSNDDKIEILDILENKKTTVTSSGKPLTLRDKIRLLKFLENDFKTF